MTKQAVRKPCPECGTKDSQHAMGCSLRPIDQPAKNELGLEAIDHPKHYGGKDNPYEVIKVLEQWLSPRAFEGFLVGNIIKYQVRAPEKGGTQDMEKSSWYANYLVDWHKRTGG